MAGTKVSTRIVCISDTHSHEDFILPDGDILIHAGDLTRRGSCYELEKVLNWLKTLTKFRLKIIIAGNHDAALDKTYYEANWRLFHTEKENNEEIINMFNDPTLQNNYGIIYLQDQMFIDPKTQLKFYGSPWQPEFCQWAFNLKRDSEEIRSIWNRIPLDTDILITHGPPYGILDVTSRKEHVGCKPLYERVQLIKPKLHVFGHIHESYGKQQDDKQQSTIFVNAATYRLFHIIMGTLMGHILPGTFFAIFAIWWGFCIAIKHFHSRHSTNKSRRPNLYHSSITFSCLCCPSSLQQMPVESFIKIICVSIGMLGEIVTGLSHPYDQTLKRHVWHFIEVNAQHVTMFFSFGLAALSEILVYSKYNLPKGIEYLANIFAFGVEGFLFHFHLHGRDDIDIHVHTLLVYNIGFCILSSIWEYNRPNEILATYCRIASVLLQGAWFYAAGFILFFPSNDPYWRWAPNHGSILIITVIFIWLAILVCIFLVIQSAIVWSILKRRHRDLNHYSVLNDDEDENESRMHNSDKYQLKSLKTTNGNGIINIDNHQDDDSDSQIEFEQSQQYSSKI